MQNLNKYQEIDGKILKIETDLKKSDERKKLVKMKMLLDDVEQSVQKMEQRAGELVGSYNGCEKRVAEISEEIKEYEAMELEESDEAEVNYLQTKTQKLRDVLRGIEKDGETIVSEIEKLATEFDAYKQKINSAKKEYVKYKEIFDGMRAEVKPQIDELKKEMKGIEGSIDPEYLEAYQQGRKERLYPVFVPLVGNNCGGCGMDLALSIIASVNNSKYIKCEHCGKLIYKA